MPACRYAVLNRSRAIPLFRVSPCWKYVRKRQHRFWWSNVDTNSAASSGRAVDSRCARKAVSGSETEEGSFADASCNRPARATSSSSG